MILKENHFPPKSKQTMEIRKSVRTGRMKNIYLMDPGPE